MLGNGFTRVRSAPVSRETRKTVPPSPGIQTSSPESAGSNTGSQPAIDSGSGFQSLSKLHTTSSSAPIQASFFTLHPIEPQLPKPVHAPDLNTMYTPVSSTRGGG